VPDRVDQRCLTQPCAVRVCLTACCSLLATRRHVLPLLGVGLALASVVNRHSRERLRGVVAAPSQQRAVASAALLACSPAALLTESTCMPQPAHVGFLQVLHSTLRHMVIGLRAERDRWTGSTALLLDERAPAEVLEAIRVEQQSVWEVWQCTQGQDWGAQDTRPKPCRGVLARSQASFRMCLGCHQFDHSLQSPLWTLAAVPESSTGRQKRQRELCAACVAVFCV
jgi:hypothetical protein